MEIKLKVRGKKKFENVKKMSEEYLKGGSQINIMTFVIFVLVVLAFIPWLMYYSRSRILVIHSQFNSDC